MNSKIVNTLINNNNNNNNNNSEKEPKISEDDEGAGGEVFMVKLPIVENPTVDHIIMKTNWFDDDEQIKIRLTTLGTIKNDQKEKEEEAVTDYGIDCVDAYEAIIPYSQIRTTAIDLELNGDEFFNETKLALTTQNGLPQFKYQWRTETSTFVYHKQKSERIKIIFGSIFCSRIRLTEKQMIKSALSLIDKYRTENEVKDKLLERYVVEEIERLRIIEHFKNEKIRIETQLTNKYAAVLNTLKAQIKYLNDVNEKYRIGCLSVSGTEDDDLNIKSKTKKNRKILDNHLSDDNETDDDDDDANKNDSENVSIILPKRIKLKAKTDITSVDVEQKKSSPKTKEIEPIKMTTTKEIEDILNADTQLYENM